MANLVSCHTLSKAFGSQQLFRGVSLNISEGDRIGLIGPNGSGKSTLLKIICGLEDQDDGNILFQKHVGLSYLAQTDQFDDDLGCRENLLLSLKTSNLDESEKVHRVHTLLSRAEFNDPEEPVASLSGGWRKRLSICRSLLSYPDVLVMDEPTNHLDIEGILWLEKILEAGIEGSPKAYLLVSHDRRFLETCTNRTIELSSVYADGSFQVNGSYSSFLEKRQEFLEKQQENETRLANKVRRETEWLRRGPKARTSKARYRIDEAHRLQDELSEVKSRNRSGGAVQIDFDSTGRKTKRLLEATGLGKAYTDKPLFSGLDILLTPGSRLGLLGRNGCGKSTLMKILAAAASGDGPEPDEGDIRVADNLQIVSFDQQREQINPDISLKRALAPDGDSVVFQGRSLHVVSWAKRFLFSVDQLETPVAQLSGGEQARILIANLMRQPADILLLDEPTNDLDIPSLDILEESLVDFPGALVLVSHDRFLLDRVCDNLIGFDNEGGAAYYADYRQWVDDLSERKKQARSNDKAAEKSKKSSTKKAGRLSYLDQREYDTLEDRITEAELEVEELEKEIELPEVAGDPDKLGECWQRLEKAKELVEQLYERWDELETKKAGEEGS